MTETSVGVRAEIEALEQRRYDAMTAGDVAALDELIDDRAAYAHSTGERDSKTEYLRKIGDGALTYGALTHPVHDVIVGAGAVVVVGEMHGEAMVDGALRALHSACVAVWMADAGRWRLVAFQPTRLPS